MSVKGQTMSTTGKIERRTLKSQVRASKGADGKSTISGYAAVFGQITDLGWFKEEIVAGAFKRSISDGADVRCLFNHDPNYILGRTKSKTLRVSEDDKGLTYDCDAPATAHAESVVAAIERGDVDGSSFGFMAIKQEWIEEQGKDGNIVTTRRILDAEVFDVSPVVFPAYEGTSCDVRSLWPEGAPLEVRARLKSKRDEECKCDCQECKDGDCADCSNLDCDDPNCEGHEGRNKKRGKVNGKKTKKVGGKDLSPEDFAYVGDKNDTSTWKLPIHDAAHVRDALARFNQTNGIPEADKDKVWNKILAAAKKFDIKVSEDQKSRRAMDPDGDGDDDEPLINALANVADDAGDFAMAAAAALSEVGNGDEDDAGPALEEALSEAKELQGLLADFISEAEKELAEDKGDDEEGMREKARVTAATIRASL